MNASRPEAEPEYSRAPPASSGTGDERIAPRGRRSEASRRAVPWVAGAGAALLVVAELTPLYRIETGFHHHVIRTISAGSHHSYALVPIAVLAVLLAGPLRAFAPRPALIALGLLGLAALGIALIGDLPEINRNGLLGTPASGLRDANSAAGIALYLETLGSILLIVAAGAGLLAAPAAEGRAGPRRATGSGATSGS